MPTQVLTLIAVGAVMFLVIGGLAFLSHYYILIEPQDTEKGSAVCTLPSGEEINFYQVIPLYEDELDYTILLPSSR